MTTAPILSARANRAFTFVGVGALAFVGCDNGTSAPAPSARPAAPPPPPYTPPPPEGCARTGSLEQVEADPTCVVARVEDTLMRETMKQLTMTLDADASTVLGGATVLLRLAIVNASDNEVSLALDAYPPGAVARPDWSRLAGVPEPKSSPSGAIPLEGFHLMTPLRTLDSHDRIVDGLPWSPPSALAASPRLLRVRLRPRGKLTHNASWWALRIPVPAPITRDDAGHRYVPKTAPIALPVGDYTIAMDLPLHGVSASEATVTTRVHVDRVDPDAGR